MYRIILDDANFQESEELVATQYISDEGPDFQTDFSAFSVGDTCKITGSVAYLSGSGSIYGNTDITHTFVFTTNSYTYTVGRWTVIINLNNQKTLSFRYDSSLIDNITAGTNNPDGYKRIGIRKVIPANNVIYDQSRMNNLSAVNPKLQLEVNTSGTLSFVLLPGHPLYNYLEPLSSFIRVYDDDTEIFYGRVLRRSHPTLTGQVTCECEGAISFLLDSEVPPDPKDSSGSPQTRTLTAQQFFTWCITQHNNQVDARRRFTVGTVNASRRNETAEYSVSSYTQTKSSIESNILNVCGGFIRVRPIPNSTGHYIDWVEQYETLNPQAIAIGVNVEDQTNELDGTSVFTVLRPVGNDGLELTEKTIDLYSSEDIAKYGRIVKTIQFTSCTTEEELRAKATSYKNWIQKSLFVESDINLVDMHYIDGTQPKIRIGDRFNRIAGLEGTEMVAFSLDLDFDHPENDSVTLKNKKSLNPDLTFDGHGHNNKKMSRRGGGGGGGGGLGLQYITESLDHVWITVDNLDILTKNLNVSVSDLARETSAEFQRLGLWADNVDELIQNTTDQVNDINYQVQQINGTGIIQNHQFIESLAGKFELWTNPTTGIESLHLKDGAELAVDGANGATIVVGEQIDLNGREIGEVSHRVDTIEGSALWTQKDNITGIVGEFDVDYVEVEDPDHPDHYILQKELIVKSGGGMKIRRNGVEYGVYDSSTLTGGLIVDKINNETNTKINGTRVNITANQMASLGIYTEDHFDAGFIVNRINGSTEAKIAATHIILDGAAVAESLQTQDISIGTLYAADATVGSELQVHERIRTNGPVVCGSLDCDTNAVIGGNVTIGGNLNNKPIGNFIASASVSNNTLYLYPVVGSAITFSKATSLTGVWSSGGTPVTFTVTATPQKETLVTSVSFGVPSWNGAVATVPLMATIAPSGTPHFLPSVTVDATDKLEELSVTDNGLYTPSSGHIGFSSVNVAVNTTAGWEEGWDDALSRITYPTALATGVEGRSFTLKVPNAARTGQDTRTFNVYKGTPGSSGFVSVSLAGVGVVGRIQIGDWYTGGFDDGYADALGKIAYPSSISSGERQQFTLSVPNADGTGQDTKTFAIYAGTPSSSGYASVALSGVGVVGRISISNWYEAGEEAGAENAGVSSSWSSTNSNVLTVSKVADSETKSLQFTVTADSGVFYNPTSHKYTYYGYALVNETRRATSPAATTGLEAYNAGSTDAGISQSWADNVLTVSRASATSTKYVILTMTAEAAASYNPTSHKYTYYGYALVNGDRKATSPAGSTGTEAYSDGQTAAGLSGSWSGKTLTVTRELSNSSKTLTYNVAAGSSVQYNPSDHTYTATGVAKVNSIQIDSITATSGVEAFNDGYDTALGRVSLPSTGTTAFFYLGVPNAARTGSDTKTFSITKGAVPSSDGYASVNLSGVGVVGRIQIGDWYDAGVAAGSSGFTVSDWGMAYQANTNNTYKVSVKVNGTTYTSGNLYATDAYTNGQNAAGVSGVWDGNELVVSRLVSSSTKSLIYTVTADTATASYNPTSHKYTYYGYALVNGDRKATSTAGSTGTEAYDDGARYGLQHVSITGYDMIYQSGTNYGYKVKVKLTGTYGGTTLYDTWYESGWVLNATNAYNNGWSGSYSEIAISPNSTRTLDPGGSVTVSAQGKASSDAGLSNAASVTIRARAVSLRTIPTAIRPGTSNTPVEIGEGYDGLNRVVVEGSSNLLAENIKKSISIFGVTGTYEGSAAAVTDIGVSYTGYSSGSSRYTKTGGSGSSSSCNMTITMTAKDANGNTLYSEPNDFPAPVTNAYNDGYSSGYTAGKNSVTTIKPSNLKKLSGASGTSLGALSGISSGSYVGFYVGNTQYYFLCT